MTKVIKTLEINKTILDKFKPVIKDNKGRKQYDFWKVVNFDEETKEITVLDYAFNDTLHDKPFNGCTGSKFEPITKERYNEVINMDSEEIADYLIDMGLELPENYKKGGFIEWAEQFYDEDKLNLFFDLSYSHLWDKIREELNLSEDEARIFNCIGGGRCFDKGYKGNINPELSEVINQFEG